MISIVNPAKTVYTTSMTMSRRERGQSALEYLVFMAMVIAAIVIMGPYVVKSVNGMIRGLEDGIKDSIREELNECPHNEDGCPPAPGPS